MKTVSSFEFKTTLPDRDEVKRWNESQCLTFLANNYGFRGVNGQGITRDPANRTLDNMRLECISQINHTLIHG